MKLEQIIEDKDSLLGGKWFKRKNKNYSIRWNFNKNKFEYQNDEEIKDYCFNFDLNAFGAYDWKWVEEKWYEGDFKEKYPNGIICWVRNRTDNYDSKQINYHQEIIINMYLGGKNTPIFKSGFNTYEYAEPVKPEDAPAIIGGKDV